MNVKYYLLIALVIVTIWIAWFVIYVSFDDKELQYINSTDCDGLKIYLDAAAEGKTFFAYWTYQTQETINFRITPENVEIAKSVYDDELC